MRMFWLKLRLQRGELRSNPLEQCNDLRAVDRCLQHRRFSGLVLVRPTNSRPTTVLQFANDNQAVLVTCNRDDFVELANRQAHHGIVIVIRRKTRAAERAALFRLLQRAGEPGLLHNVNIA
jgi:tRNA G18 (ribose-2'-O)-methylase SpoU